MVELFFWNVTHCSLIDIYRCIGGYTYVLWKVNESVMVIGTVNAGVRVLAQPLNIRRTVKGPVALNWPFYKSREVGSEWTNER
jgi:hypothetical protein